MMTDASAPLDPDHWRSDFPILSAKVRDGQPLAYLDNAATTQRPQQVIQSLVDTYQRHYANVHRGIHWLSDQSTDLYEQSREKLQRFIGAGASCEVIFTTGTTGAINLIARSWGDANVSTGDEILLTEMEHHANLVPWQQLAQRTGCRLRHVPLTDDGHLQLDSLDQLLTERTKLFAMTAVSNVLGTINPVPELIERAHRVGALTLIDAAQSVPHAITNVQEMDADFLAFSGHKMMGPSGVGVLYGKENLLDKMPPFLGGGSMIRRVRLSGFEPADLPAKFEAGTPPIVPAIGLGSAVDYLQMVGLNKIHAHQRRLNIAANQALSDIEGIRFLGPSADEKSGIVTFTLNRVHAHDIAQLLDRQGIAVRAGHHCAMPLHQRYNIHASTRASFYLYNTLAEVQRLADGLRDTLRVFRRRTST